MKSMLALNQYGFIICALLCDGASCNLAVLKQLCNHKKGDELNSPFFISRFNGQKVHLIICPSHQLKNIVAALYSSCDYGGTKDFANDNVHFGWETI
jgi:hypothetical protein